MQPADSNGLADPYVKIIACGVERETAVIERTLQPIWYQRLSIPLDLPRDLTLAPKVRMCMCMCGMHTCTHAHMHTCSIPRTAHLHCAPSLHTLTAPSHPYCPLTTRP